MNPELMLEATETSLLIIEERERRDIVVGVPHHAPAGVSELPCPEHRVADENAGFLGRYLAEKLKCCSVIACNYPVDVNKSLQTDYGKRITTWEPEVLIEIHGHGALKAKSDIEISSGGHDCDAHSKKLADRLAAGFAKTDLLRDVTVCGEYDRIYFKASATATILEPRWISYHIELPPELRKPSGGGSGKPPEGGYLFCDLLVGVLWELNEKKGQ